MMARCLKEPVVIWRVNENSIFEPLGRIVFGIFYSSFQHDVLVFQNDLAGQMF